MKKWIHMAAALLLCAVLLLPAGCRAEREPLLYINGEAVSEAEFALLGGDVDRAVRMKVLQQWAQELELAGPFSYEELMEELSEENERRAELRENGGVVYGVVEYSPLQYYNITMGEYEQMLRDELLSRAGEDDLRAYYQEHLENYREIGEITAEVTVRSDGRVINQQEVLLAPDTYRSLSEGNELLVMMLEDLQEGQETSWTDESGLEWTAVCTGRTEDTYQPFEDIQGAVGAQYAAERLARELDQRAGESTVEDLRQDSKNQS